MLIPQVRPYPISTDCDCIFSLVPLTPSGFNITGQFDTVINTTIRFEWDPPKGIGVETVVDFFSISISPRPLSQPALSLVYATPWNVTIDYNVQYTATIAAANCAGESEPFELSGLRFSK